MTDKSNRIMTTNDKGCLSKVIKCMVQDAKYKGRSRNMKYYAKSKEKVLTEEEKEKVVKDIFFYM